MQKNDQSRSETERAQQENPNPGSMSATAEKQRTSDEEPQQMPTGNEQNSQDTQGTVAGVGE